MSEKNNSEVAYLIIAIILAIKSNTVLQIHLEKFEFPLALVKQIVTNWAGNIGIDWYN